MSDSLPETVFEEDEFSDPEESKLDSDLPMVMESDDILDDASSRLNESRANDSMLGASILEQENEYNWALENIASTPIDPKQRILDMDAANDQLFIIFDDLKLIEVNL